MENSVGNKEHDRDLTSRLEEENKLLREELQQLQKKHQAALVKLEEQLAVEKKYEESQLRFRTIFEQSKLGSKIITPDLQIIQVNQAFQDMLGYSKKELVGTKIIDYAHADFKKQWQKLQENLWTKKIPSFQLDACLIRKDGSTLWCEVNTILFEDKQDTLGYTILEDITDRKSTEEKLQKQTSVLNRDMESFIYTASHDLKAPVVNIEGLLKILTQKLNAKFLLNDEQYRLISMIAASIDRLKSTITDLTEVAKTQQEDGVEEFVSINTLVDEVYQDLSNFITHTPVKLHKNIAVDKVKFTRKNMRSILHNLLSNAIKYHSPDRSLEISIETQMEENYVVIIVTDNGLGISESHQQKLFSLFKRFHTHVEGTGIGLYMIKKIIENANGKIEVESILGEGSVFKVFLPGNPDSIFAV